MIQKQTQNVKIPLLYVVCILLFSFTALAAPMTQIYVGQDPYNNNPVSYSLTIYGMLWNFDAIGVQACQIDWGAGNGWEYISKGVNNQQYVVSHTYAKGDLGEKVIRYRCQDVNGAWSLGNTQYTHYDVIVLEDVTPPAVSIYLGEEPLVHNEYVYTSRVYANLWNNESQTFVNACEINWGDGSGWKSVQTGNENQWYSVSYDYTTPGEKTVQYRCRNTVGLWSFGNELHRDFSVITIDESAFCVDNHQATVDIISLTPTRGVLRVSDLDDTSAQLYVQLYESDYETLCADIGYVAQGQDIEFTHTCPRGEVFGLVYGVDSCGQTQSPVWKGSANRPNAPPTLDAIPDQFVNEGETLTVTLVGSDPDGDSLTYSRVSGVGSVSGNVYTFIAPFYPGQSDTVHDVTVRVRDGFGGSAERTFRITVKNVNRPPVLEAIPDQVVNEGETLTVTLVGSDPDGDSLTYSRVSGVGSVSGNVYTFTAPFYAGQSDTVHDVTVRVRDGFGGSAEQTFRIAVKNVNRAPTLDAIPDQFVNEGETLTVTLVGSDPDGDSLTYSRVSGVGSVSGNVYTFIAPFYPGQSDTVHDVTVRVRDGFGGSAEQTFRITVKNVNRPPVLEAIPDQIVNEGETLTVTLVGSDPDGDSLTYSRVSGVGSVSGNVYTFIAPFYPGQSDTVHDVTVRVRDGFGGSAE
ncbi:MAG: Ig-like domain-containing protein, partial [Candidatus Woesearchaeota archaeon]